MGAAASPLSKVAGGEGVVAGEGYGFGAVGCIGLFLGRCAAGFLFVSTAGTLANATICRFLRVFLSQMDKVSGGTNGYAPLLEGGWSGSLWESLFNPQ